MTKAKQKSNRERKTIRTQRCKESTNPQRNHCRKKFLHVRLISQHHSIHVLSFSILFITLLTVFYSSIIVVTTATLLGIGTITRRAIARLCSRL